MAKGTKQIRMGRVEALKNSLESMIKISKESLEFYKTEEGKRLEEVRVFALQQSLNCLLEHFPELNEQAAETDPAADPAADPAEFSVEKKIDLYSEEYLLIVDSLEKEKLTLGQASKKFAELMTRMEIEFKISQLPEDNKHLDLVVFELYKQISNARDL